jgi:hypothetical protein
MLSAHASLGYYVRTSDEKDCKGVRIASEARSAQKIPKTYLIPLSGHCCEVGGIRLPNLAGVGALVAHSCSRSMDSSLAQID